VLGDGWLVFSPFSLYVPRLVSAGLVAQSVIIKEKSRTGIQEDEILIQKKEEVTPWLYLKLLSDDLKPFP
jgi:hypothetical protein